MGCNIVQSSNGNKHPCSLVTPYNRLQMTKIFIKAQRLVRIIEAIIESLPPVLTLGGERCGPVGIPRGFVYSRYKGLESANKIGHRFSCHPNRFPVLL